MLQIKRELIFLISNGLTCSKLLLIALLLSQSLNGYSRGESETQLIDSPKIEEYVNRYAEAMNFSGTILVARNRNTIFHKSYGNAVREWNIPNSNNSKYQIASISKPMTALVVVKLAEEGMINLDHPISEYLPGFPREKGDSITIHQLLTHTGGIGHYQDAPEIEAWKERLPLTREELIKIYGDMPLVCKPGSRYYYSSFGYNLLAYICEAVTGSSFERLLKKYVFEPALMKNSGLTSEDEIIPNLTKGYEYKQLYGITNTTYFHPNICIGSGDVFCTAEDLFRFSDYIFNSGTIAEDTKNKILTRYISTGSQYYGYGWIMGNSSIAGCDFYSHGGRQNGFQSELWYYPKHDITIIILSNIRIEDWEWGNEQQRPNISGLRNNILKIILNKPVEYAKKSAAKEFSELIRTVGIDSALIWYRNIKNHLHDNYYLSEIEINMLGYNYYARNKDFKKAKTILLQNVTDYPNSYNVYDSMGWLYDQTGEKDQAKYWYRKGLSVYEKYPEENKRWIRDVEKARKWLEETAINK